MLGAHNIAFLRISMGHFFLYNSLKGLNLKSESDDFLAPKHFGLVWVSVRHPTILLNLEMDLVVKESRNKSRPVQDMIQEMWAWWA